MWLKELLPKVLHLLGELHIDGLVDQLPRLGTHDTDVHLQRDTHHPCISNSPTPIRTLPSRRLCQLMSTCALPQAHLLEAFVDERHQVHITVPKVVPKLLVEDTLWWPRWHCKRGYWSP